MVLTKEELTQALQNEIRILMHLIDKLDPGMLDYRPTPKQRSTLELLRYLSIMGPQMLPAIKTGTFDMSAWQAAQSVAAGSEFEQIKATLAQQSDRYAELVSGFSDSELRGEIEMFGRKGSRGSIIVNLLLCGHAAYRTQLFLYLKANGRDELNTFNLWAGIDGSM
jgi:hypothetical protein